MRESQQAAGRRQKWIFAVLFGTIATMGGILSCKQRGSETSAGKETAGHQASVTGRAEAQTEPKITQSLTDHRPETVPVSLSEAQTTEVKRQLDPLPGRLKLEGPVDLEVYEAGQRLGRANEWIDLPAGEHDLELHCCGYRSEGITVRIPANHSVIKQSPDLVAESTGPTPGTLWAIPDLDMTFAYVAPGSFEMGADDGDRDERPIHTVTLSRGYWLGIHEVTQQQYESLMGDNPSKFQGPTHPVEKVSWNEAVSFCQTLTKQERESGRLDERYAYRLPTEAEWEFAARGGIHPHATAYAGSNNVDEVGWCQDDSDKTTHPVGQKQANELGLYDMTGNVWEWCLDWLGEYPSEPQTDPVGPDTGMRRVIRGGSWDYRAAVCRVSNRHYYTPTSHFTIIGFRVVLAPAARQ